MKTMRRTAMRRLTLVFPILSALVAIGITGYEYNLRERMKQDFRQTEREYARLSKQIPHGTAIVTHHDDDDHHDDEHHDD